MGNIIRRFRRTIIPTPPPSPSISNSIVSLGERGCHNIQRACKPCRVCCNRNCS